MYISHVQYLIETSKCSVQGAYQGYQDALMVSWSHGLMIVKWFINKQIQVRLLEASGSKNSVVGIFNKHLQ